MAEPPIDKSKVSWDEPSRIDASQVKWDESTQPPTPSLLERAGRVAGLGGRAAVRGLTGLPTFMAEIAAIPLRAATGGKYFESPSAVLERTMTKAGLPEPSTGAERFATNVSGAMAGTATQLGLINQLRPATQSGEALRQTLLQEPKKQVAAAATGSTASQAAEAVGAGPTGQLIAGVVGGQLPFAPKTVRGPGTVEHRANRDLVNTARREGYRIPASEAGGGLIARGAEGIGGKTATNQTASVKNQEMTNRLAKRAIDFPEDRVLSAEALDQHRGVLAQPYEEVRRLDYSRLVPALGRTYDTEDAVRDLREARRQANLFYRHYDRSQDPASLNQAEGFIRQSEALEGFLEQAARAQGQPGLLERFRTARTQLAKSYNIERALDDAVGNISAQTMSQIQRRGAPLTNELRMIANIGRTFPRATQTPRQMGQSEAPFLSPLDFTLGIGMGAAGSAMLGPLGLGAGALPLIRPMARAAGLSSANQRPSLSDYQDPLGRGTAASLGLLTTPYTQ
jgi:hypothetical protein